MTKPKILSLNKSETHQYYCIEKKQEFFAEFRKILKKLDFYWYEVENFGRPCGEDGKQKTELNIHEIKDVHELLSNDTYIIDVIFNQDRIHVIITSRTDKQDEISKLINKHFSIKKVTKHTI